MKQSLGSTLDRAVDILLTFDEAHPQRTVDELAVMLGRPKSTVYRYVRTLQAKGLLARTRTGGTYSLGVAVLRLARAMRRGHSLMASAGAVMRRLAEQVQETVLLSKLDGLDVVCLDRSESRHGLRISFEPGSILPAHASAPSKAVLAHAPEPVIAAVIARGLGRYTPTTITDPEALRAELARVRACGYATSDGELDLGTLGLAVPVWDASGAAVASIGVATPSVRTTLPELIRLRPLFEQAAEEILAHLAD